MKILAEKAMCMAVSLLACALLLAAPAQASDKPLVAFANPGGKGDAFFQLMTDFMQAAANDLGFELEVYYGDRNHVLIDENITAIFNKSPLPDYIIGMNARGSGERLLEMAELTGIKTVFVNQSFLGEARGRAGYPGENFKHWLFEYLPDDVHSGYLLARTLIEEALAKGLTDANGRVQILAISGHDASPASVLREEGLKKAVAEYPSAMLRQVVHASWKRNLAREQTKGLVSRYPEISVIWAASDKMALGVCEGLRELGKQPGGQILTGGVDWASLAMNMVENGDFTVTVGGHFMDGAWALVMLYDIIHGSRLPRPDKSTFSGITKKNIASYKANFNTGNWDKIDFTRFSKHANPELEHYEFGLDAVLKQFEEQ